MQRLGLVVALVAGIVGLGTTGVAQAAPAWLSPLDVSTASGTSIGSGRVAIAPDGTVWATHAHHDGTHYRAQVAMRPPGGGAFTGVTDLSAAGQSVVNGSTRIAVDGQGNVTAAWLRFNGSVNVAQAAYRPVGGNWGAPQDLSDTTVDVSNLNLAVGDSGAAAATWQRVDAGVPRVETATRPAGSPTFGSRTFVSPASGMSMCAPQVAVDAAGDAVVLWQRFYDVGGGTFRWVMEANAKPADGSWSLAGVQTLSRTDVGGAGSCTYDVALTPQGRALAIWDYNNGGVTLGSTFVEYAERTLGTSFATGTWSPRQRASSVGLDANQADVAFTAGGTAVATWLANNGTNAVVQSSVRESIGAFSAGQDLSGPGSISIPLLAASPGGDAMIAWVATSGGNPTIFSARRQPGGQFGEVRTIAASDAQTNYSAPSIALDDQGNAFAVFTRRVMPDNLRSLVGAAFDAAPPAIGGVSVPGSAVAGQQVAMSATASDRASSVSLSWSFGDGTGASGLNVAHAFGAPGSYTVTVTATDGAGNSSSQTRAIQVTSASGPPQPPAKKLPTVKAPVKAGWKVDGSRFTLTKLVVAKPPKQARATLRCSGKKCPFKSRSTSKVRKGKINVLGALGKQRTFRAKQTLELRVSAPGLNTKVLRFALKKGKQPKAVGYCLSLGKKKVQKRC